MSKDKEIKGFIKENMFTPVREGLPPDQKSVFIRTTEGHGIGWYSHKNEQWCIECLNDSFWERGVEVNGWMEIPE